MKESFDLNREVANLLKDMRREHGGGSLRLPGKDQHETNAFGIALAWRWARRIHAGKFSNLHTYAVKYENKRSSHFEHVPSNDVEEIRSNLHEYQFLTDVFIERWRKVLNEEALVAAEVEAYPGHPVSQDLNECDYLWDYYKLLYARSPRRLLVACVQKDNMAELERVLAGAYLHTSKRMPVEEALAVVLFPAGETELDLVRTAWLPRRGKLRFLSLDLSARATKPDKIQART